MHSELKPCPFCGSTDVEPMIVFDGPPDFIVSVCKGCGARGPEAPDGKTYIHEPEAAVAAWNSRAANDKQMEDK